MSPANVSPELLPEAAKGLVFDCDGTLVDSMALHYDAWKATCDEFDMQLTTRTLVELAGTPPKELFAILAERSGRTGKVEAEAFFTHNRLMYDKFHRPGTIIGPVIDIVRAGRARGLPIAVASGGMRWFVDRTLAEAGITDLFDAVVCAEDVARGKPAPDAFLLAAEKLGVAPHLCVGYEDGVLGLESIHNAGFMAAIDVKPLEGYPHLL